MKDATKLMEAASNLYSTVGPVGAFLIVAFILIVLIYRHFQRKQFYNFYYEVLNQKEAQIQRVADENREWRNYFWITNDLTEQQIMTIQKPSDAEPLIAPQSGARRRSKRGR